MIGEIPYTMSQVEPKEIFKNDGNLEVGQTICIIEAGGFFEPKALLEEYKKKFPDENILLKDIKPTKLITDGISPMESGETVMIFGWRTPELDGNTCYGPVGEYQGKYLLEDSQWIQQIPQELKSGYKDYKKPNDEMIQILNSK